MKELIPGCNDAFEELFYCRSLEERIAWMEAYLLGEFKRFHGLYPSQAKQEALERR